MMLLDTNVLIYAHRPDARRHAEYRDWVRALVNGAPKRLHVCTSCIRAGKVTKPVRRTPAGTAS